MCELSKDTREYLEEASNKLAHALLWCRIEPNSPHQWVAIEIVGMLEKLAKIVAKSDNES